MGYTGASEKGTPCVEPGQSWQGQDAGLTQNRTVGLGDGVVDHRGQGSPGMMVTLGFGRTHCRLTGEVTNGQAGLSQSRVPSTRISKGFDE